MPQCPYCNLKPTKKGFIAHKQECYNRLYIELAAGKRQKLSHSFTNSRFVSESLSAQPSTSTSSFFPAPSSLLSQSGNQCNDYYEDINDYDFGYSYTDNGTPEHNDAHDDYNEVDINQYIRPLENDRRNLDVTDGTDQENNTPGLDTIEGAGIVSSIVRTSEINSVFDMRDISSQKLSLNELLSLRLLEIINRFHLSDACYEELIAWANDIITVVSGYQNVSSSVYFYQILSPHRTQNVLEMIYPVKEQHYDICKQGCHLFMTDELTECWNDKCKLARYKNITEKKAYATMLYLPIADQLATFIAHSLTRQLLRNKATSSGEIRNIFDGSVVKEKYFGDNDLVCVLYVDGFCPYIHSVVSMTIVHLVLMNLPDDKMYKNENMLQASIIPTSSHDDNLDSFLAPLIQEMKQLESRGIDVLCDDGVERHYTANLVMATGDIPGCANLCHHSGHMSYYASLRGSEHNIKSPSPFTELKSFSGSGPFFFGCDEMHLYGCNIGPGVFAWLTNPILRAPYLLNKAQKISVSNAIKKSIPTWPGTFEGIIKDVMNTTKDSRAVDFIALLQYVVPTIVIDQLEATNCPKEAISALACLVKACSLSLSWKITTADIESINEAVKSWHNYAVDNISKSLQTVCLHYLHHVPEVFRLYGPLRGIGARCMERSVGLFDKMIKSTKSPGVNAGNQLKMVAASRFQTRTNKQEIIELEGVDPEATRSQVIYYGDRTSNEPELWGPHLAEMTTDDFADTYNLTHYLRNYWARVRKVLPGSLPLLKKNIHVGKCLNFNEISYDCKLPLRTEKHGTFIKLELPVDKNAYGGLASEDRSEPRVFFGEALLFLLISTWTDTLFGKS
ncbi:hypothetical protein INT45_006290 [Circinella minor]|uniref:Uncharacterized protein n=1 Tax=Circinella minor TaxID=1195481 RepID=A0A8H7V950_9FUNG|nr:hypothetical protein INT45_006290 [Circinella minor]